MQSKKLSFPHSPVSIKEYKLMFQKVPPMKVVSQCWISLMRMAEQFYEINTLEAVPSTLLSLGSGVRQSWPSWHNAEFHSCRWEWCKHLLCSAINVHAGIPQFRNNFQNAQMSIEAWEPAMPKNLRTCHQTVELSVKKAEGVHSCLRCKHEKNNPCLKNLHLHLQCGVCGVQRPSLPWLMQFDPLTKLKAVQVWTFHNFQVGMLETLQRNHWFERLENNAAQSPLIASEALPAWGVQLSCVQESLQILVNSTYM